MRFFKYRVIKTKTVKGKWLIRAYLPLIILVWTVDGIVNFLDYLAHKIARWVQVIVYFLLAFPTQSPFCIILIILEWIFVKPLNKLFNKYERESK